ncbi:hypothetical protein AB0D10_38135 [Kitasatospora sp. NPDC048545]|uniref:hypothetical protein n=1 Tax=Kitasatospora sp. NPDC048545 TaxID=3157208 RepID=UPI0033C059EA
MTTTQTTWPDDVLARYLTAGKATVDITTDTTTSGRCETGSCTRPWDALDGHPTFEITLGASCTGTGCRPLRPHRQPRHVHPAQGRRPRPLRHPAPAAHLGPGPRPALPRDAAPHRLTARPTRHARTADDPAPEGT